MSGAARLLAIPSQDGGDLRERYQAALDPEFLETVGWDPDNGVLMIPPDHPALGYAICHVTGCDVVAARVHGLCPHCHLRWKALEEPMTIEEFWEIGRTGRMIGEGPCVVTDCPRPALSTIKQLCRAHNWQRTRQMKVSMETFLSSPLVVALPSFGPCRVVACPRQRDSGGPLRMCRSHGMKWALLVKKSVNPPDLEIWCRTQGAVVERGQISLRGLPDLVIAELLLGLQLRSATGTKTPLRILRFFTYRLRVQQVASIVDLDGMDHEQNVAALRRSLIGHLRRVASTPEEERHKDIWNATVFGHRGTINFTGIRQRWMRESLKEWAFEELPTHRGKSAAAVVASKVKAMRFLSDSLHLQRADHGEAPGLLTRADIVGYLNRMAYLETSGTMSRSWRVRLTRDTARILRDFRALGFTQSGRSAAGMPEDFALRRGDIPQEADDDSPGRALPDPVMRHLYSALPILEERSSREIRVATELMMDTGRRPDEILNLPLDCLDQDRDGKYVLIFEDFKLHRKNRRLPITDGTAAVIEAQRNVVIARYPKADRSTLPLLPSTLRNPRGQRPIPQPSFGSAHRTWIHALLPIELPGGIVIDKPNDLVPYAYRHSYAQRHADAGVPLDVLRDLMGHNSTATTEIYYRVTEKRTREAIDRVSTFQFDRHGNRIWRQAEALLDDERARMQIGQVAVPYGICTEPTNVQAGGHDCPFRFRCVGCGHFRTDASYLPDLRAYLQDLLRDRERVLATGELDQWARSEAVPSEAEIQKVRQLVRRVEHDLDDLTTDERDQINNAIKVIRKTRRIVNLGTPRVAPPRPDQPGETA
ncbi:site-specific integrase [Nocardia sp. NPDC051911]|uniref:tyrosine-type recombinase/integrase n=1 Tax=Nocardia sp. NPDC051911 TaxID=3154648 RepID=UPI00342CF916